MKIAVIVDVDFTAGGGFNQALNAIVQIQRMVRGKHELTVLTSRSENLAHLEQLEVAAAHYMPSWRDRLTALLAAHVLGHRVKERWQSIAPLEARLIREGVDLIYFVEPTLRCLSLQKLNYIMTVWDSCHRDAPEFPEVRSFGKIQQRENMYRSILAPVLTLTDPTTLALRLSARYGIDRERLLAMPFAPTPFLAESLSATEDDVLTKYNLRRGYYYYLAQFWAHKNHTRILQALVAMKAQGLHRDIVFAGGDQGNLGHVKQLAHQLGVASQVQFLGFVPSEDLRGLYLGSCAIVMPTYFGPTNLPPLEAWNVGTPLIYSRHLQEQVGDAALLVDPDDSASVAAAMTAVLDEQTAQKLAQCGRDRLEAINQQRRKSEETLAQSLDKFAKRRQCWS